MNVNALSGIDVEEKCVIPRNDGPYAVGVRVGLDDEPKQEIDHIHNPDSLQTTR